MIVLRGLYGVQHLKSVRDGTVNRNASLVIRRDCFNETLTKPVIYS